ncbi:hypothetical protein [Tabrizicola fusiformis]|uniref:hypothetical protein n=1 Tax=Tabrizicola sp. SY72 TaxID=2741673 RepID=UPI001571FA07|nr:hypothetical protein [Tabrizicola sp. SY72]NTT85697.1 hypothetical protein [Tabrizicola sp. SY72]
MELLKLWLPFIILVGVWIFFLRGFRQRQEWSRKMIHENNALLLRIAESNERIVASLEARPK